MKGKAFAHTEMNSQDGGCVVLDLMPPDRSPVSVTSSIVPSRAPVTRWRHQQWKGRAGRCGEMDLVPDLSNSRKGLCCLARSAPQLFLCSLGATGQGRDVWLGAETAKCQGDTLRSRAGGQPGRGWREGEPWGWGAAEAGIGHCGGSSPRVWGNMGMTELEGAHRSGRSSWSSSARLSLVLSAPCRKHTTPASRAAKHRERSKEKLLAISVLGGLAFRSC